ncbi:homoserine kinase [Yunchengibacter salinarum]|uniref:homoserine kinase n=1 Tax=Yunchengibacter salinarum TaxID=3133399 RepID=UPI0035B5B481
MAVYTAVSGADLERFLAAYDLGAPLSFKGIAEGVENSNYFLETEAGRFILTLYEKRANPDDLPYFLDLMAHLAAHGLPAPPPIPDRTGRMLQSLAGRPACLISFLTGTEAATITPDHTRAVGAALAHMHRATADFPRQRANDLSLAGWQALWAEIDPVAAESVHAGLGGRIEAELAHLATAWPARLPTGTIHADLFPDNVLFTGTTVTGLIDFYFACTDFLAYDLAVCLNAWCINDAGTLDPALQDGLIAGYESVRALDGKEKAHLPLLARGAALRFLLTRLYDWLNPVEGAMVRAKDPRPYLHRLTTLQALDGQPHG